MKAGLAMSKFEELFDDIVYKAKNVADVAGKKTGDVVNFSKLKYQVKQTQWDIEKAYSKLGAFVYESRKSDEDFTDLIELAINEVDLLCERMEHLELQIRTRRNVVKCASCGKENDDANCFCARCGSSLEEEKKAAEATARAEEEAEAAAEVAEAMDEVRKAAGEEKAEEQENGWDNPGGES